MKSAKKTTSKVVSTKPLPSVTNAPVAVGGGGFDIVGPGMAPQLKDYKKPGAT